MFTLIQIENLLSIRFKTSSFLNNFIEGHGDKSHRILLVIFLIFLIIPIFGMFGRDYCSDVSYIEKTTRINQATLNNIIEDYDKLLGNLVRRLIDKEAYRDEKKIIEQLREYERLKKFATETHLQNIIGLRWIGINKVVLGPYGTIKTFPMEDFTKVIESLTKNINGSMIFNVKGHLYMGIGARKESNNLGFLLVSLRLPTELIAAKTHQLSLLNVVFTLIENNSERRNNIISIIPKYEINILRYLKEQYISTLIIFLMSGSLCLLFSLLGLKNKRKIEELTEANKAYVDCMLSFQEINNIFMNKYQKITENNKEITNFLLEARKNETSNLLSETEENKLIEKLYLNNMIFNEKNSYNHDAKGIDILPILKHCINARLYEIKTNHINLYFETSAQSVVLFGEISQFYSLFLKILSLNLLRTPEDGSIWIKVKSPTRSRDGLLSITFEDNGFAFSDEKMKQLADSQKGTVLISSDLDWVKTTKLAKILNFEMVMKVKSKNINMITLIYSNKNIKEQKTIEYTSQQNVIPFRKE